MQHKRQLLDHTPQVKIQAKEEWQESDPYLPAANQSIKKRKNKQLGLKFHTKKFIKAIKDHPDKVIDLKDAALLLKISKRRIYDITNILEGFCFIEKVRKNIYRLVEEQKPSSPMQSPAENFEAKTPFQQSLDQRIEKVTSQIMKSSSDQQTKQQFNYFTEQDIKTICNEISPSNLNQYLLAVSAPPGTTMNTYKSNREHVLEINSNGNGKITLFDCKRQYKNDF